MFADALRRIARQLVRLVPDRDDEPQDRLSQRQPALAVLFRNAMLGNQTTGKDAGKPQRVEFGKIRLDIKPHGRNCAQAHGYSLHANTRVGELARGDLEKLLRYVCRPAIAAHRLEQLDAQTIRISLRRPSPPATTPKPQELQRRLGRQLETRAHSARAQKLTTDRVKSRQNGMRIIVVRHDIQIGSHAPPLVIEESQRIVQPSLRGLLMPHQHLSGGLYQGHESALIERLGRLLVAAHRPWAHQRGFVIAHARHGYRPAFIIAGNHFGNPARFAPQSGLCHILAVLIFIHVVRSIW